MKPDWKTGNFVLKTRQSRYVTGEPYLEFYFENSKGKYVRQLSDQDKDEINKHLKCTSEVELKMLLGELEKGLRLGELRI